jgi:hypothetical protein
MTTSDEMMAPPGTPKATGAAADESTLARLLDALTAELRQGIEPDVETVVGRHPALAADLRSLWATIWVAETLAATKAADREPSTETHATADTIDWPPPTEGSAAESRAHFATAKVVPVRFGDYELYEELGQGGMGVVLRAREIARGRLVAIKRLLRGPGSAPGDFERFRLEALAAAGLAHPHIVPVFQVGEHDGQPFFTMQLIEGTTLARRLAAGPMPAREAARLLATVCNAVDYAHGRGVLHRDLKPSNILIDRTGNPYVSDFGLAKRLDFDPSLTPSGAIVGTPSYMAPEQAGSAGSGQRALLSPAADVYSLGAVLYHMLTGRPPFQADTPIETLLLALEHDPVSPRVLNPRVSPDLEMIALKCLQKSPAFRYQSAAALAADLDAFQSGEPVSARSASLRALAARLMGETHHTPVLENWGSLWICHSIALLVFFGVTNWLHLRGVTARWPYVLIFSVGLCGWAALFWALRNRGGPIRFVERQLAHIWAAGIVSINLVFLVEWLLGLPVLTLCPMFAVTNGALFLIKAGVLSGDYYVQAALTFLAIFPMAMFPGWAPLIFGAVAAACFFVTGLKYRLRRLRST